MRISDWSSDVCSSDLGECPPDRLAALVVAPRRSAKQVPRYIDRESVEQIIAACDTSTPVGVRDRALILLLARLGLRAGDIVAMQLDDIDWDKGTVRVSGKSIRPDLLPLPQDAEIGRVSGREREGQNVE